MTNLLALLTPTGRSRILRRPLAVPGERAAARARELGFSGPVAVAGGADDAAMLAAVTRCAEATSNGTTGPA
jgi:uroporphyrinogen-III synthase